MTKIAISSGHGIHIRGASGDPVPPYLDEVDEAIKVMNRTAEYLRAADCTVQTFTDTVSTSQSENLDRIVDWHNSLGAHDLDVSIHFNAYEQTETKPMGTECLYVSQHELATEVAEAIAGATGLPDRGAKKRTDLAFLNGTAEPAILVETVFCDALPDCEAYRDNFDELCHALAEAIYGEPIAARPPSSPGRPERPPRPPEIPPDVIDEVAMFHATGKCSWFGGPEDTGVSSSEGLAFIYDFDDAPHLFLPDQPQGTSGLARRLNADHVFYLAVRWDYDITSKGMLADPTVQALVRANGREFYAWPADWGPHEDTDRVADLSPALMKALGITTDDEVEIIYPAP